ncbi:MAG: DAK2 domain-containing protein [Lachnospiraceae bacterium]|nr:DAK2 domain-containing protein [Lachnospiraceae bacterium]
MFLAGAHALNQKKEFINELNVFPVPDGDTGTNMTMTVISAAKDALEAPSDDMEAVCRAISGGALRGARGNSGVIMSQLLRGFMRSIREKGRAGVLDIAEAMVKASESAYRAVMKPKEGTILTVARCMAEKAAELAADPAFDEQTFFGTVLKCGEETLEKTPELLPVLKQAGVVDSGGKGLMVFLQGAYEAMNGKPVEMALPVLSSEENGRPNAVDTSNLETSDIRFAYCTEFIIHGEQTFPESAEWELREFLEKIGDSIVCVSDEDIIKIHVHTNHPGQAIEKALTYGELSRLKIDNMKEEHRERLFKDTEKLAEEQKEAKKKFDPATAKELGFLAVSSGPGLGELFTNLGVDYVIHGGQTMNPSTEDFLKAASKVNAKHLIVFPNNVNIILAAEQASKMSKEQQITVIPTRSVPEGISAMINFLPECSPEENVRTMKSVIEAVKTIEVTYSVRDTEIDGVALKKGDYMAISGKSILASGPDLEDCVRQAIGSAVDDDTSVISIYYGEDVNEDDAEMFGDEISASYPDVEVEVTFGGQPVYSYLISVE